MGYSQNQRKPINKLDTNLKPAGPEPLDLKLDAWNDKAKTIETKNSGLSSSTASTIGSIASGLGTALSTSAQSKENRLNPEGYVDNHADKAAMGNKTVDGVKDTVATVGGPMFQFFRGIQQLGEGIGDTIGGEAGGAVSGIFSPEEGTIYGLTNKDFSFGEKLLSTVPGLGGAMMQRDKKRKREEFIRRKNISERNKTIAERERDNRMRDAQDMIDFQKGIYEGQLGILRNNYEL